MAFSMRAPATRVQGRRMARGARVARPAVVSHSAVKVSTQNVSFAGVQTAHRSNRQVVCNAAMRKKSVGDLSKSDLEV